MESKIKWLEPCISCDKKHWMTSQPCPACGVYHTGQPSEKVLEKCNADYACDGCQAYRDHNR